MKRARNETVEKVKTACSSVCARLWNTRAGNRVLVSGMAGLAALLALLHRMGVPLTGWLPPCPFHRLTGLNCPGCGTTRMLEALLSGDVAEAFSLNPFFFLLTVLAVGGLLWFFLRTFLKGWHPVRLHGDTPFWVALLILFLLFGVVRTTPWYHMYFY